MMRSPARHPSNGPRRNTSTRSGAPRRSTGVGAAIGVFDSGVGGLTVLQQIAERLPHEHLIYLGDTARYPYGSKWAETVRRYALENTECLADTGIKTVVVACIITVADRSE